MTSSSRRTAVFGGDAVTKNLAASVRQRLTNKAKETNRPFQEVLQYFAMERFLELVLFLGPLAEAVEHGSAFDQRWVAPGSWRLV